VVYVRPMSGIVTSGKAATLRQAKADFQRNWDEVRHPVGASARVGERPGGKTHPRAPVSREQANAAPYRDCEQSLHVGARRRIRLTAMLPPVLQRSFRDAVTISKLPLRNMQTLADQLNI
jgi:hypothetical protein